VAKLSGQERFDELVAEYVATRGVTPPGETGGFGRGALRIDGKIFAMFVRGRLVVKLPKARVDELVNAGEGERFDANKGTPMKEWFSLDPASRLAWRPLSEEAFAFVGRR
jgi:hypothetical protein